MPSLYSKPGKQNKKLESLKEGSVCVFYISSTVYLRISHLNVHYSYIFLSIFFTFHIHSPFLLLLTFSPTLSHLKKTSCCEPGGSFYCQLNTLGSTGSNLWFSWLVSDRTITSHPLFFRKYNPIQSKTVF
jgi:hypothetical protein